MHRSIRYSCLLLTLALAASTIAQSQPWTAGSGGAIYYNGGNIGIGESSPPTLLTLKTNSNEVLRMDRTGLGWNYIATYRSGTRQGLFGDLYTGWGLWTDPNVPLVFLTNGGYERMRIDNFGRVGIGTNSPLHTLHVSGDIFATGNITGAKVIGAAYQDLAEWVPATKDMVPGTVVALNPDRPNEVMPSSGEYDTSVAGVVSSQPGVLLGEASSSKEMIATVGRVKVRVSAKNGAIRIGDLLVTSDRPGLAMRSEPVVVAGVKMHRPGTLIGKALEPLPKGEGEILVLLSLQ